MSQPEYYRGGKCHLILVIGDQQGQAVHTIKSPAFDWDKGEAELKTIHDEIVGNKGRIGRQWLSTNPGHIIAAYLSVER